MLETQRYLNRAEASDYLRSRGIARTPKTLAKLASIGGGPLFRKFGRKPMYAATDLDQWIADNISPPISSTAELHALSSASHASRPIASLPFSRIF